VLAGLGGALLALFLTGDADGQTVTWTVTLPPELQPLTRVQNPADVTSCATRVTGVLAAEESSILGYTNATQMWTAQHEVETQLQDQDAHAFDSLLAAGAAASRVEFSQAEGAGGVTGAVAVAALSNMITGWFASGAMVDGQGGGAYDSDKWHVRLTQIEQVGHSPVTTDFNLSPWGDGDVVGTMAFVKKLVTWCVMAVYLFACWKVYDDWMKAVYTAPQAHGLGGGALPLVSSAAAMTMATIIAGLITSLPAIYTGIWENTMASVTLNPLVAPHDTPWAVFIDMGIDCFLAVFPLSTVQVCLLTYVLWRKTFQYSTGAVMIAIRYCVG